MTLPPLARRISEERSGFGQSKPLVQQSYQERDATLLEAGGGSNAESKRSPFRPSYSDARSEAKRHFVLEAFLFGVITLLSGSAFVACASSLADLLPTTG